MYNYGDIITYTSKNGQTITAKVIEERKNEVIVIPLFDEGEQRSESSMTSVKVKECRRAAVNSAKGKIEYKSND